MFWMIASGILIWLAVLFIGMSFVTASTATQPSHYVWGKRFFTGGVVSGFAAVLVVVAFSPAALALLA